MAHTSRITTDIKNCKKQTLRAAGCSFILQPFLFVAFAFCCYFPATLLIPLVGVSCETLTIPSPPTGYERESLLGKLLFGITWVEPFTYLACGQKEIWSAKATHTISIEIRILNLTKAVIAI